MSGAASCSLKILCDSVKHILYQKIGPQPLNPAERLHVHCTRWGPNHYAIIAYICQSLLYTGFLNLKIFVIKGVFFKRVLVGNWCRPGKNNVVYSQLLTLTRSVLTLKFKFVLLPGWQILQWFLGVQKKITNFIQENIYGHSWVYFRCNR